MTISFLGSWISGLNDLNDKLLLSNIAVIWTRYCRRFNINVTTFDCIQFLINALCSDTVDETSELLLALEVIIGRNHFSLIVVLWTPTRCLFTFHSGRIIFKQGLNWINWTSFLLWRGRGCILFDDVCQDEIAAESWRDITITHDLYTLVVESVDFARVAAWIYQGCLILSRMEFSGACTITVVYDVRITEPPTVVDTWVFMATVSDEHGANVVIRWTSCKPDSLSRLLGHVRLGLRCSLARK